MEKKEIQKWRDRLIKMFGIYHSDGQEYVTCPLCGINLDELAKHMIEELDKAREGGFFDETELLYLMMLLQNDNAKGRDTERPNKTAKEKISKLLKQ